MPREPCDLVHPEPVRRFDVGAIEKALDFACASGGTESALTSLLEGAAPSASTWDPSAFEHDIFLDDLVARAFRIDPGSQAAPRPADPRRPAPRDKVMRTLLTRPPEDRETIVFRQTIVRELDESPAAREDLVRVHQRLSELFALFGPSELMDDRRSKQLQILRPARASIV